MAKEVLVADAVLGLFAVLEDPLVDRRAKEDVRVNDRAVVVAAEVETEDGEPLVLERLGQDVPALLLAVAAELVCWAAPLCAIAR